MAGYAPLPAYQAPNALNFQPLSQGIDDLSKGVKEGRLNALNRDIGQAAANGDWKGAQNAAFGGGQIDQGMGIAKFQQQNEAFKLQQDAARLDHEHKVAQQTAGIAQMILQAPPDQGRAMWQRMNEAHPEMGGHLAKYGIDPNDHVGAAKFMIAEARGYVNPLEEQSARANLDLVRANTHKALRGDEPEIVRQLRAAGIDPSSGEGRDIIRQTIKGESPLDKMVADAIKQPQPTNALALPQPSQQGGIQPQSNAGPGVPQSGLILAADGQPAPQQTPPAPPTGTTAGSLFQNVPPERKRALAEAMLMNPKTKAMGEQMIKDLEQGHLDKTARGEIEKKMVGNIDHVARLNEIEASFKPEYLQVGFRVGQRVSALGEIAGMKLDPKSQQSLAGYTSFRADTARNFNLLLKENSGTAVTENEYKRMQLQEPNAGAGGMFELPDSPTEFMAKLKTSSNALRLAIARQNFMRKSQDPSSIAQDVKTGAIESKMSLDGMKRVIDDRLGQEKQRIMQQQPNIDPMALRRHLLNVQKQEFGI